MPSERVIRHPNGGALKIGTEVHVSADSWCDEECRFDKNTEVFDSTIARSRICNSKVFNSRLGDSLVWYSTVAESACSALELHEAILHRVIAASTILSGNFLTLRDVVAENCELYGNWTLEGNARIHEGVWHRKPRFLRITGDNQVDFGLTECKPGYAMLGCWCKPLTELLRAGPRLGRKRGWSEEQIKAAKEFYEQLGDVPLDGVRP